MAKATKKQALGRGLSALLKDPDNNINSASDKNADKVVGNIVKLDIDDIEKGIQIFIDIKEKGEDINDIEKYVHMYS